MQNWNKMDVFRSYTPLPRAKLKADQIATLGYTKWCIGLTGYIGPLIHSTFVDINHRSDIKL